MVVTLFEIIIRTVGTVFAMFGFFGFLTGDNITFLLAEGMCIGGFTAYTILTSYGSLSASAFEKIVAGSWLLIIPLIFGILVWTRMTRYRWLSRYPVAVVTGASLGSIIGLQIRTDVVTNVRTTINNIILQKPDIYSAIFMLLGMTFTITYFTYSGKYSEVLNTGRLRFMAKLGRYVFFISLGYLFAWIFYYNGIDLAAENLVSTFGRLYWTLKGIITGTAV